MSVGRLQSLDDLLAPSTVAVVGASANIERMSGVIVDRLTRPAFQGTVLPVNPKYDELFGVPCYPSLSALPTTPDLVIVYLSAARALDTLREAAGLGVRAAIVISAGFSEVGTEGAELQDELIAIARASGLSLCGPNTAGLANFHTGMVAFGTSVIAGVDEFHAGGVAVISSSGGLATSLLTYLQGRHVGMSHLIGVGNEAVTDSADFLRALAQRPEVTCITAVLEAIRRPAEFFAAAESAIALGKPVIVLKQGRSEVGRQAMLTHTGAMGGGHEAFLAACRRSGILVVQQLDELADAAMMLTRVPAVAGYDLGILSVPGGGKSLSADSAHDFDFELPAPHEETFAVLRDVLPGIATPENPLDPTAGFARDGERLRKTLTSFWSDPHFDVAVLMESATEAEYSKHIAGEVMTAAAALDKPMIAIWESGPGLEPGAWQMLHRAGFPLFASTRSAFAALALHRQFHAYLRRGPAADVTGTGRYRAVAERAADLDLTAGADPMAVLRTLGVAQPQAHVVTDAASAVACAAEIGRPVAVKSADPTQQHKTEHGGVELNVSGDEAVRAAYRKVTRDGLVPALVQEMAPTGVEILVGVNTDEQFGQMVTVGYGGVATELFADVAHRQGPVSERDVAEMLSELKCGPLLTGFRGLPQRDTAALIDIVTTVSWGAYARRGERPAIEINPVIVLPAGQGAVAVDCVASSEAPAPAAPAAPQAVVASTVVAP